MPIWEHKSMWLRRLTARTPACTYVYMREGILEEKHI